MWVFDFVSLTYDPRPSLSRRLGTTRGHRLVSSRYPSRAADKIRRSKRSFIIL